MKKVLLTLWQLPQCIIAWLMMLVLPKSESFAYEDKTVFLSRGMSGGISLGEYIILHPNMNGWSYIAHEYGHCRQSLYLGWLYLIVIGIPSLLHAAFFKYDASDPCKYYRFFTERWADKLGKVERMY